MKNIFKVLILLAFVLSYSCEGYDPMEPDLDNTYPSYVEIANTSGVTVPEGGNITVTLSSRTLVYKAYSVSYEISGDYSASGTVEVPTGVNSVLVSLPVDAGIVTDEALSATVTLTSATNDMEVGRNGVGTTLDVTITKFVPFAAADYAITFDCDEPGYAVYPVTFVVTSDPLVLTNTNFWDSGWSIDYTFSGDFDQVVTINEQDVGGNLVSGSGVYNGVTKTMVVDYVVIGGDGSVRDDNTHTFTVPAK
jgi:hypothetical protein